MNQRFDDLDAAPPASAGTPSPVPAATPTIRQARPGDCEDILRLVRALAAYEREPGAVAATAADFETALFGPDPAASCLVAEADVDGSPAVVGLALWFATFSTWTGRHGMWVEDLFVLPSHRRQGLGRALLASLAAICVERGWPRLEWTVLDWNEPAWCFYREMGAVPLADWTTHRVTGEALAALARPATVSERM